MGTTAAAATAASPCPNGYACVWAGTNYGKAGGYSYRSYPNADNFGSMANRGDSAAANGSQCAGNDPGTWWRDRVSSYRFVSCGS